MENDCWPGAGLDHQQGSAGYIGMSCTGTDTGRQMDDMRYGSMEHGSATSHVSLHISLFYNILKKNQVLEHSNFLK